MAGELARRSGARFKWNPYCCPTRSARRSHRFRTLVGRGLAVAGCRRGTVGRGGPVGGGGRGGGRVRVRREQAADGQPVEQGGREQQTRAERGEEDAAV